MTDAFVGQLLQRDWAFVHSGIRCLWLGGAVLRAITRVDGLNGLVNS